MDPLTYDPAKLVERLVQAGEEWADKNAAAELLEETKSTLLATLAVAHIEIGDSAAKAELRAKSSAAYADHLKDMVEARRQANRARVRYDSGRVFGDHIRTKAATERAQMEMR